MTHPYDSATQTNTFPFHGTTDHTGKRFEDKCSFPLYGEDGPRAMLYALESSDATMAFVRAHEYTITGKVSQ